LRHPNRSLFHIMVTEKVTDCFSSQNPPPLIFPSTKGYSLPPPLALQTFFYTIVINSPPLFFPVLSLTPERAPRSIQPHFLVFEAPRRVIPLCFSCLFACSVQRPIITIFFGTLSFSFSDVCPPYLRFSPTARSKAPHLFKLFF